MSEKLIPHEFVGSGDHCEYLVPCDCLENTRHAKVLCYEVAERHHQQPPAIVDHDCRRCPEPPASKSDEPADRIGRRERMIRETAASVDDRLKAWQPDEPARRYWACMAGDWWYVCDAPSPDTENRICSTGSGEEGKRKALLIEEALNRG